VENNEVIKNALMEILNKEDLRKSFNKLLHKHGLLENKVVTIEFKIYENSQVPRTTSSQENELLAAPLAANVVQFGSTWCGTCPPPPGKWI
jgi:hypothetical protein